jgi:hypothetical protein
MKAQKRFSIPLVLLLLSLSVSPITAQTAKKKPIAKPAPNRFPMAADSQGVDDQQATAAVDRLLAQSGLKYTKAPSGIWIIPRGGQKLRSFQIVLSYTAGTLTTEVVVAKVRSVPRLNEAGLNLLSLANRLLYVKICIDKENVFVRNETVLKFLNLDEFKMNLESVATATEQVYGELQSFR